VAGEAGGEAVEGLPAVLKIASRYGLLYDFS
jgi:hypothetical protein